MMKIRILIIVALLFLPGIVSVSAKNESFTPDFQAGMKDLPPQVKNVIDRVINWGIVVLVAVSIIFTLYHGILAHFAGEAQNAMSRSKHITNAFMGLVIMLVVISIIIMINFLFT